MNPMRDPLTISERQILAEMRNAYRRRLAFRNMLAGKSDLYRAIQLQNSLDLIARLIGPEKESV